MNNAPLALLKDAHLLRNDACINGDWIAASRRFDVTDPATGVTIASVANLGAAEIEAALAAANATWPEHGAARRQRSAAQF